MTSGDESFPSRSPSPTADFRALYEAECAYVWNSLRRLGVREADIDDAVHDVFFAVAQKLSSFDRSRPIRPWLFGFAYRIAFGFRRRKGQQGKEETLSEDGGDLVDMAPRADELLSREEDRALVVGALETLEPERRAVFILHEIDGTPVPRIAEALEIPLNTAYSRLRLAREDFVGAVRRLNAKGGSR